MAELAPSEKPRTKWWRRLLLVIAVGPLAATLLTSIILHFFSGVFGLQKDNAMLAVLGALWGLTTGILRRSLVCSLIGLHWGAIVGAAYAYAVHYIFSHISTFDSWPLQQQWLMIVSLHAGVSLGGGLNVTRTAPLRTILLGACSGLALSALAVIGYWIEFNQIDFVQWINKLPLELGSFIFNFIPLTAGLYLFFWLIADVLPRRELARDKKSHA
jgi:hypothetical protein